MMISIIIPCYNSEKHISRAIDSVIAQSYTNWELILVNNNSTDNTLPILENYKKKYPLKILVLNETKIGAPAARNKGLSIAQGEWIQFLDADDKLPRRKLEKQLRIGEKEDVDVVVGKHVRVVCVNNITYKLRFAPEVKGDLYKSLIKMRLGITSAILWRKERLCRVNGWDEALTSTQEYDLMFRLLIDGAKFTADLSGESTLIYCEDESITRSSNPMKNQQQFMAFVALRERIKKHLVENELFTKKIQEIINIEVYNCYLYKKEYLSEETKTKYELFMPPLFPRIKLYSRYKAKRIIKILTRILRSRR